MTSHFRGWVCAFLSVLVMCAAPAGSGAESGGKSFMWRVGEGDSQVYILGSLHMLKPGFYPLPPEIEEAFARSKALVVEIDENQGDPLQRQLLTLQRATYAGDETLSSRLSPKTREALEEYLAKSGQRDIVFQKRSVCLVDSQLKSANIELLQVFGIFEFGENLLAMCRKSSFALAHLLQMCP